MKIPRAAPAGLLLFCTLFIGDPLYSAQAWVYEMINIEKVWSDGITGKGVSIRVNDNGIDADHPSFSSKFDIGSSCDIYKPLNLTNAHGTVMAAIAAADGNKGCSAGIAPGATLSSCVVAGSEIRTINPSALYDAFQYNGSKKVDISTNSWGVDACRENKLGSIDCEYFYLPRFFKEVLRQGTTEGRDGKGIIHIFSAGNEHQIGERINFEPLLNTRYTITVGAVTKGGKHASYSTTGAALFMSAPGGDRDDPTNLVVAQPGGTCGVSGSGTSFGTPIVAGIVALVLEINPDLGWRDVQGILASTAVKNDPDDISWTSNAAGFHHSYKYGFGTVDATAAVDAAKTWKNFPEEREIILDSGIVDLDILDNPSDMISLSVINVEDDGLETIVESVVVQLNLVHYSRGDLEIVLTSPNGTISILHPGSRSETTRPESVELWELMSVRNWGEPAVGNWTLSIVDILAGSSPDCVDIFDWYSSDDESCYDYTFSLSCKDGGVGPGWNSTEWGDISDWADENDVDANEACCECGGGLRAPFDERLVSWNLIVYGHDDRTRAPTGTPTYFPSIAPTRAPTDTPSTMPSREASTESPTMSPSETTAEALTASISSAPIVFVSMQGILVAISLFASAFF